MAKFVAVLAVVLLAIQNVPALPVEKDSWDVFQYAQFLTIKIQEEYKKVTTDRPQEIKTFSDKINTIFSVHNIQYDVATFKRNVRNFAKDSSCKTQIENDLNLVVKSSLKQITSCEDKIQSIADEIASKLKSSAKNASILEQILNFNVLTCAEEYLGSYSDRKDCLESITFDIIHQFEDLQKEIDDTLQFSVKSTEEGMKSLEECVVEVEEKIVKEESRLLSSYGQC